MQQDGGGKRLFVGCPYFVPSGKQLETCLVGEFNQKTFEADVRGEATEEKLKAANAKE